MQQAKTNAFKVIGQRLAGARWTPSPFHSARPSWADIELVILHCISLPEGAYGTGYPAQLFLGGLDTESDPSFADLAGLEVSSHFLVDREGQVQQFVELDRQAWHAGLSQWRGRSGCNRFSIGIEIEGCESDIYTQAQYEAVSDILRALLDHYPGLSSDHIVGHQEVASGRKTDPGPGFDWTTLLLGLV